MTDRPDAPEELEQPEWSGGPQDLARALKLTPDRWVGVADGEWGTPIAFLAGAWVLMAWNRLGLQGFSAPRAVVRFLLIGFYGWLAMTAAILVVDHVMRRKRGPGLGDGAGLDRMAVAKVTARAHQPIVVWGFVVQFLQVLPVPYLATALAGFAFLLWLPALLVAGVAATNDRPPGRVATAAAAGWFGWVVVAGWYLWRQLGHLV